MTNERHTADDRKPHGDHVPEEEDAPVTPPAEVIGGDETGANTGVKPGERPIVAGPRAQETPVGNDPTRPGGGHGEGP